MALSPGSRIGPYLIESALGAGGMGQVYRARDTKLDRPVAVKILPESFASDPDRLMRFDREAKTLATLNHPHIAQIYGVEESSMKGGPTEPLLRALIMELVDGEDLAQSIGRGPIPVDDAIALARQIAEALEAAHDAGIIHRDLKPANIKVRGDGSVKVLDFGLAKALPGGTRDGALIESPTITSPAMTHAGMILGTAAYMSPEQAKGKSVDKRTDIWAFGCVLYEMLSGRRAFAGDDVTDTLTAILRDTPKWDALPSNTPVSIRRLIARCLERDPKRRLRDIGDARLELDESANEGVTLAAAPPANAWIHRGGLVGLGVALTTIIAAAMMRWQLPAPRPVERFVVTSASDARVLVDQIGPSLAMTADGQQVIYHSAATDPDGARVGAGRLLVRRMGAFETTPLLDLGNDPGKPFTSPDGAWIGFETHMGAQVTPVLAKAPLAGGAMVMLCDLGQLGWLQGASWDASDRIVFATSQSEGGLFEIAASGGMPKQITTPDAARGEADHVWPEVLPGNAGILFTIARLDGGFDVAVLPHNGGAWRTLVRDATGPRYVSSGAIVYASGGAVFAVGFDPSTLSVTTDPVQLAGDLVIRPSGSANFAIAADGTLVYVAAERRERLRRLIWLSRDGATSALPLEARDFVDARLSPDGRRVALLLTERGTTSLWFYDIATDAFTRFTPREESFGNVVWSPDGRRLVIWNAQQKALLAMNVDGSGTPVVLVRAQAGALFPYAWSPDGTIVAYVQESPTLDSFAVSLEPPHEVRPLTADAGTQVEAAFSKDGKWIVYSSFDGKVPEVMVAPASGEGRRWPVASTGRFPRWATQDAEILFRDGRAIYGVSIDRATGLPRGRPAKVLDVPPRVLAQGTIELAPDGRFLMLEGLDAGGAPPEIRIVRNALEPRTKN